MTITQILAVQANKLSLVSSSESDLIPVLDSRVLFQGERLIKISHQGSEYFLRITRAGKLILTK